MPSTQIVPGMTRAEDLPNLGFDARTTAMWMCSPMSTSRNASCPPPGCAGNSSIPRCRPASVPQLYCTGFVFHPSHTATKRMGAVMPGPVWLRAHHPLQHWSAEVILLVMDGHVVHKVFSGHPRTENLDDKRQPLGPLHDLGGALAHAAGSVASY